MDQSEQTLPEEKQSSKFAFLKPNVTRFLPEKWRAFISNNRLVLTVVSLIFIIFCLSYLQNNVFHKKIAIQPPLSENQVLTVLYANAMAAGAKDDKITITFSDPVDPHAVSHMFFLSPAVRGKFVQGYDSTVVEFIPAKPFKRSINYSLLIKEGLVSISGKRMLSDYIQNFSAHLADNEVQFVVDDISSRILSIPADREYPLTIRGVRRFDKVRVTLYRSDKERLMDYMTYNKDESITEPNYYIGWEQYKNDWSAHEDTEKVRDLKVPEENEIFPLKLPVGIYYLEAREGKRSLLGSTFIVVTNKGITYRQDDKQIVLAGFDLKTGSKLAEPVDVELYNFSETPTRIASHTFPGHETTIPFPFTTRLDAIIGSAGDDTFIIPVRLPNSLADVSVSEDLDKKTKIFLYTDRPIYKPGDTVKYRGIVRIDNDGLYKTPPSGQSVRVWLSSQEDKSEYSSITTEGGVFSGEFTVPTELSSGTQYLYASTKPKSPNSWSETYTYFDIADYVKPTFDISTSVEKADYFKNDKLTFTIKGTYFDGKPLANKSVSYSFHTQDFFETERSVSNKNFNINLQGGMCGGGLSAFEEWYGIEIESNKEVTLDKNGTATVTFSAPKDKYGSQTITMVAKAADGPNEIVSAVNTIVHAGTFNIFFMPASSRYAFGEEVVQPFYAETRTGEKMTNTDFEYELIKIENAYTEQSKETVVEKGKVRTDGNGKGLVRQVLPKGKGQQTIYLAVKAVDEHKNTVENRTAYSVEDKENLNKFSWWRRSDLDQTYLKIVSNKNSFVVGDEIELSVVSPAELDVLMTLERGRVYQQSLLHIRKGTNTVTVPVKEDLSPSITVVFSYFAGGEYHTEGVALNVPAMHKLLQVQVKADKETYRPGETAQVTVTTKDSDGNGVPASLSLGIIDKAIFGLRKSATPPIHSSLYYFRPRRTNASSSLTLVGYYGGGGGGGGGGDSSPIKQIDTLYWNPNLTTDSNGEVTVTVPLGKSTTTWKVQAISSTFTSQVGQGESEFIVAE